MGAWHGDTAANHNSTHFLVWSTGPDSFFGSTGLEVISKFPSHSSLHIELLSATKKIIGRRYLREASDIDCIEYTGKDCIEYRYT